MLCAKSNGEATLAVKNDMDGVSTEDILSDISKIKDNVREMIEASGDLRYDLILSGGSEHAWITELGSVEENGSFSDFISEMLSNECDFSDMTVNYKNAKNDFNVKYSEYFMLNGIKIDTEYGRYENAYVDGKIERGAEIMRFSFGTKTLTLNYEEGLREQ